MKHFTVRTIPLRTRNTLRGFTIIELIIATAITALVMLAVASLQYISGRCIVETYGQTRTRSSRMRAIDQVYYRLCDARNGSVSILQNGRRIDFLDPNKGTDPSTFFFNPTTKVLYYDSNINDGIPATPVVSGPIDMTFANQSAGTLMQLRVKSASQKAYGEVDTQEGDTAVHLRNPIAP